MIALARLVKAGILKNRLRRAAAVRRQLESPQAFMAAVGQRCVLELVHLGSRPAALLVDARGVGGGQKTEDRRADGSTLGFHIHK